MHSKFLPVLQLQVEPDVSHCRDSTGCHTTPHRATPVIRADPKNWYPAEWILAAHHHAFPRMHEIRVDKG